MNCNKEYPVPSLITRNTHVWYRTKSIQFKFHQQRFSAGVEPLIMLAGLGIGFKSYIQTMGQDELYAFSGQWNYRDQLYVYGSLRMHLQYLCPSGIRQGHDGMLGAPLSPLTDPGRNTLCRDQGISLCPVGFAGHLGGRHHQLSLEYNRCPGGISLRSDVWHTIPVDYFFYQ
jgi:hypothetical protein